MMRLRLPSFVFAIGLCTACAQIIGLSDYEKVGGGGAGGASQAGGKTGKGGSANAEGGEMPGTGGAPGAGGATGTGGTIGTGGAPGSAGDIGAAGVSPDGGVPGAGGASTSGGKVSTAGAPAAMGGRSQGSGGAPGAGGTAPPTSGGGGSVCTPVTVDLLADDGNFDGAAIPGGTSASVTSGWYQNSSDGLEVVLTTAQLASYGVTPLSTPRSALLGEIGDYQFPDGLGRASFVGKVVTIPASATAITASCRVRVATNEANTDGVSYDYLDIWLWDDSIANTAFTFDEFSNLDMDASNPNQWWNSTYSVTADKMPAVAGKTLAWEAYAFADDSDATNFFVDNCSLTVKYCN